jgi:putative SOS response-associated peptidase YedK
MCGRFTLRTPAPQLLEHFGIEGLVDLPPRYNIAPTQEVLAVRQAAGDARPGIAYFRWGLIPSWSKDAAIGNRMINARGETVSEKPAFRAAVRQRRCLVAADGFYEWKKTAEGSKQPYFVHFPDDHPMGFAGLWDAWQPPEPDSPRIETCTIITTDAHPAMRQLHPRMPVIVSPEAYRLWLDPSIQDPARVEPLLAPIAELELDAYPVTTYVNSPHHEGPQCSAPSGKE